MSNRFAVYDRSTHIVLSRHATPIAAANAANALEAEHGTLFTKYLCIVTDRYDHADN